MTLIHSNKTFLALLILITFSFSQSKSLIEPSFSLSLSGKYGNGTEYRYLLNRAGDSGVVIVNGLERPVGWKDFRRIKAEIVNHAMDLTEAAYGAPRDSTDFTGELALFALDRATVVRINTRVVIGTQNDSSMAVLLRLLMKQVDDTLRLPQVHFPGSVKKRKSRNTGN